MNKALREIHSTKCANAERTAISIRSPRVLALWLLPVLLIGACRLGAGESPPQVGTKATSGANQAGAAPAEGELPDVTFAVNQEFWHSGFHITLEEGHFYAEEEQFTDQVDYFVSLQAQLENLTDSETWFDGQLALAWQGDSVAAMFGTGQVSVPAGLSSQDEFQFLVNEGFDLDSARLIVGTPEENQAQVPLGPQGGELISLAPSQGSLAGVISLELIDLRFTGWELRADIPARFEQVEAGKRALTLEFDATSRRSGNWTLLAQAFALILPSGDAVGVHGAELGSLPGAAEGIDTKDLYVRFLVDQPVSGQYTLRFAPGDWFVGSDGVSEGSFEFTLE